MRIQDILKVFDKALKKIKTQDYVLLLVGIVLGALLGIKTGEPWIFLPIFLVSILYMLSASFIRLYRDERDLELRKCLINIFTLLGVVFLIVILMSIAIPNFLESKISSKSLRARSNLGQIAQALELYMVDNSTYPEPEIKNGVGYFPSSISSKNAFLANKILDVFSTEKLTYRYWISHNKNSSFAWFIASMGPDRKWNIPSDRNLKLQKDLNKEWFRQFDYDPTNGIISSGDIIKFPSGS